MAKDTFVSPKGFLINPIQLEKIFLKVLPILGWLVIALMIGIIITLTIFSIPSIEKLGFGFITGKIWNPVQNMFGAMPFLVGTLITSILALLISIPFALSLSILLGEYFPKGLLSNVLKTAVELTAAIPSVIYGFWGFFVLVPVIREFEIQIGVPAVGVGILPAAIILAIMIIPYAASMGTSIVRMVNSDLKEGAYALGATRWEVIKNIILPAARSGIGSGFLLALGRAIGETMAVTMVIGNANIIPDSIFSPGNTMASVIANEFSEADNPVYLSALIELGLLLFVITFIINLIGKRLIKKSKKK